jgi:hypothetical protein
MYVHENPSTSSTCIIQSKEFYHLHALDARLSHIIIPKEVPVPNMSVSGKALLLSLSLQLNKRHTIFPGIGYALRNA